MRKTVIALLTTVVLGACSGPSDRWQPTEVRRLNEVVFVNYDHTVRFDPGGGTLASTERGRLDAFLLRIAVSAADEISVDAGGTADGLGLSRADEVAAHVRRRIPGAQVGAGGPGARPEAANVVRIVVGRYSVIPPDCPNWSKPSGFDPTNSDPSNFGCASTTNLGLMVADPADLVRGRALAPMDGEAATLGIQRYRAGEIRTMDLEEVQ